MQIAVLYFSSAAFFLVVDAVMLSLVLKPLFDKHIGHLMRTPIDMSAAILFYLFYIGGLVFLVTLPAFRDGSVMQAAINGAVLGAVAYGTYELTNKAVLQDWEWPLVFTDWAWGTVLTGSTAAFGVWVALKVLTPS